MVKIRTFKRNSSLDRLQKRAGVKSNMKRNVGLKRRFSVSAPSHPPSEFVTIAQHGMSKKMLRVVSQVTLFIDVQPLQSFKVFGAFQNV